VNAEVERLVSSLLYEGYALYPYTPGATKNATPTPFGIIYPPGYAKLGASTFDVLRLEGVLAGGEASSVSATVRFLQPSGERHEAVERRVAIDAAPIAELAAGRGAGIEFEFDGARPITGRARLRAEPLDALDPSGRRLIRIRCCVHNTTAIDDDEAAALERPEALIASLLSTHVLLEAEEGAFASPLEREGVVGRAVGDSESVNTFPVLAGDGESTLLGAAIVLPERPRIAPQSLGSMFDNTEIEEALLLHVHALSDGEREQIADQDPAVRQMVARAESATPGEMIALHGTMMPADPGPLPEPGHPNPGESRLEVNGVEFRKGSKVVLRPGTDRDVLDRMLDGRTATIERLYIDYDDAAHIAVTVDDDPGQELFRETGRYLFFRANELEAVAE
jgi:hypothetical protein